MKVHHILSETLDVKQIDGMWRVFDTVKNAVVGDIGFATAGEAEAERDSLRARPAADTGANNKANTPSRDPIYPDTRPGTPNSSQLTRGEQRKLSRSGRITRSGVTYTRANIDAADADLARAANAPAMQGDTRAGAAPDATEAKSKFSKLKNWAKNSIAGKIAGTLFNVGKGLLGGTVVNLVLKSIDIITVVAAHNAYFTELEKFVEADTPEKRAEIVKNLADIRQNQIVEPTTELFFGALGMAVFGSAGAAIIGGLAGVALTPFSGGVSFILTLIAGGVAMYGAYEGSIYAAKTIPMPGGEGDETIYVFFRTKFDEVWLTPGHLRDLAAEGVDVNFGTYVYALMLNPMQTHTSPLSIPGPSSAAGAIKAITRSESIAEAEDDQEEDNTASVTDNIAPKLKKAVLADPKLKQLYILGKAEIKKAVRDQENTDAS